MGRTGRRRKTVRKRRASQLIHPDRPRGGEPSVGAGERPLRGHLGSNHVPSHARTCNRSRAADVSGATARSRFDPSRPTRAPRWSSSPSDLPGATSPLISIGQPGWFRRAAPRQGAPTAGPPTGERGRGDVLSLLHLASPSEYRQPSSRVGRTLHVLPRHRAFQSSSGSRPER